MRTPCSLARLPTPLEPLPAASASLGADIWIKRDDMTGIALSGNKVRKLEHLLAEAVAQGADTVLTTGGIQSNHCRATAVACRRLRLQPVLLLRGAPPAAPEGNLLLDLLLGADVRWTDAAGYARRDEILAEIARELEATGRKPYVIPEGGSNALGSLGYVQAGKELAEQAAAAEIEFDSVVCAVGSGGTLAGLAMSGLASKVWGVAVCDDAAYFRRRVEEIGAAAAAFGQSLPPYGGAWEVLEGFQGLGYALATQDELASQAQFARDSGIFLDPVYTGKAWYALEQTLRRSPGAFGERVLFWHTGGIFGVFGRGGEYGALWGRA